MERWDKVEIPHKGWAFENIEDYEDEYIQCEMCGKEGIRFVHILSHPEYGEMRVGCECASKMLNDYVNPQQRERLFRNKINRLKNFLKIDWRYNPVKKTHSAKYKGEYITIKESVLGTFGVFFQRKNFWNFNGESVRDLQTAKRFAFEIFDEKHITL